MEFVRGDALPERRGSEALARGAGSFMRGLGRVLALDTFLNNWDRLPALRAWPHQGNLGNLLVDEGGDLVAIDQTVKVLTEPQKRAEYYNALRAFVDEVFQAPSGSAAEPPAGRTGGVGTWRDGMRRILKAQQERMEPLKQPLQHRLSAHKVKN